MSNFKKLCSVKIISVIVAIAFLFNSTVQGMDLSSRATLRKPLLFNEVVSGWDSEDRVEELLMGHLIDQGEAFDLEEVDFYSEEGGRLAREAIVAGKVCKLNLRGFGVIEDKEKLYKTVELKIYDLALRVSDNFSSKEGDKIHFALGELLFNAFTHGNKLDCNLPIFIHLKSERTSRGRVIFQKLSIFDMASKREITLEDENIARDELRLYGRKKGIDYILKDWDYGRKSIVEENGPAVTQAFFEGKKKKRSFVGLLPIIGTFFMLNSKKVLAQDSAQDADISKLSELASQGDVDALKAIEKLAYADNNFAEEALKNLNPKVFIDKAYREDSEAVFVLRNLAHIGNGLAFDGLVELASQGNSEAVFSLTTLFVSRDNLSAKEEMQKLNPKVFVDKARQGKSAPARALRDLAYSGNTPAFDSLVELASQGNRHAVFALGELTAWDYWGNSAAKEAAQNLDPQPFIDKASQGDHDAVFVLDDLSDSGNILARKALKNLNPKRFIEKSSQGNRHSVWALERLASSGNSAAEERIKNVNPKVFVKKAFGGDHDAALILRNLAYSGNSAALEALVDLLKEGHKVEINLRDAVLNLAWEINLLHNENSEIRFAITNGLSIRSLYFLIVYAEEELFTSTFNGLFNRLINRMQREGVTGDQLIAESDYHKFRTFLKLCAGFDRLNKFLNTMESKLQFDLLKRFGSDIEKEENILREAVTVADTFGMLEDLNILKQFQFVIKSEYERVKKENHKEGIALYSLLAGMFGERAVIDEAWFKEMSRKYGFTELTGIFSSELFNPDGRNIQQYFFYDDRRDNREERNWDGHHSFRAFLNIYGVRISWDQKGNIAPITKTISNGWQVEDKGSYVQISSVGRPKKVEIFANKPTYEEKGPGDINSVMQERDIKPIVVVHRGHSYHVQKTIGRIPSVAKIVALGSCGSYSNISMFLDKASDAHIISTKGTGTMLINDPLFKMLNDLIASGQDINWPEFWGQAERFLGRNGDFRNYIAPHKNLGVLFLKAYRDIIKREQENQGNHLVIPEGNSFWPLQLFSFENLPFIGTASIVKHIGDSAEGNPQMTRRRFLFGRDEEAADKPALSPTLRRISREMKSARGRDSSN